MPESLFAPRRFRRSYLVACFAGALVLEGSLVGIAQIYAHNKSWDIAPVVTELDTGPVLGDPVQELILPKEDPAPTPDQFPTRFSVSRRNATSLCMRFGAASCPPLRKS